MFIRKNKTFEHAIDQVDLIVDLNESGMCQLFAEADNDFRGFYFSEQKSIF